MSFFIENRKPSAQNEDVELKRGAFRNYDVVFADYCDRSRLPHPTPLASCLGHDDGPRLLAVLWLFSYG